MQALRLFMLMLVLSSAGFLAGCGPPTGIVSGEVTVDGTPLDEGDIVFSPADNAGVRVDAKIKAGKYQVSMIAGKKFVQISALKVVDKRKDSDHPNAPFIEVREEFLPPRYHSESELTFEVKPGNNTKNWSLESKDRKP